VTARIGKRQDLIPQEIVERMKKLRNDGYSLVQVASIIEKEFGRKLNKGTVLRKIREA
jgi:intein-encoded DNA endonuclease-like protein